jgi:hypothetical protein
LPRTSTIKQAPALAPAAQQGNGQSPDGFGSPIPQLRRKSPPAVVLGVLLIAVCAFGIGAWALNVGHRSQVLVVARPVQAGSVISASDLTTAGVAADHSVSGIPASAAGQVVGKVASDNLVPGTLLVRAEVGGGPSVPSGSSVVGLDLKPGMFPTALEPGDSVAVVSTPSQASSSNGGAVIVSKARVFSSSAGPDGTSTLISVVVPSGQASAVAAAGAQGSVSLVLNGGR